MANTRDVLGDDATLEQIVEGTITSFEDDTINSLRDYVFRGCYSLTTVSLPSCASVGDNAFYDCYSLATVSLPSCTFVGNGAFYGCYNLVSLHLTDVSAVPTLKTNAFSSTPIGGYSASAGQYGSVYVPASLYESFLTATNWSSIASRIVSVA